MPIRNPFAELKNACIPRIADGVSLDTRVLEEEMRGVNGGIELADLKPNHGRADDDALRQYVPHFGVDIYKKEEISGIVDKFPAVAGPSSMVVGSADDLSEHMAVAYQLSHFHYILGKKHNLKGSFPKNCCGMSARSLMLSLIELGYPNAAYAYSTRRDHGYTLLPFVLEGEDIKGTIVVDPTSDQLWNGQAGKRNDVFIKLGDKWEYKTDWGLRGNLFPNTICSIDILRRNPENLGNENRYHAGGTDYLRKAFSNPLVLDKA